MDKTLALAREFNHKWHELGIRQKQAEIDALQNLNIAHHRERKTLFETYKKKIEFGLLKQGPKK